jgi:hypothetical protein
MSFPELWARYSDQLSTAGIRESEAARMPLNELRSSITFICESRGEPPPDFEAGGDPEVEYIPAPGQRKIAPPSPQLNLPGGFHVVPAIKSVSKIMRQMATDAEAAVAEGISELDLNAFRSTLVADLAIYYAPERSKYAHQIRDAIQQIEREPTHGITIAVLLYNGTRVTRTFPPTAPGSHLYLWCASEEKMLRAMIKPGSFVIVRPSGVAIRPSIALGDQISERHILLNLRLILSETHTTFPKRS